MASERALSVSCRSPLRSSSVACSSASRPASVVPMSLTRPASAADFRDPAGERRIEILRSLPQQIAQSLGAPGQQAFELPQFVIERRTDGAGVMRQRLIDFLRTRRQIVGEFAPTLIEVGGNEIEPPDDMLLEARDAPVERIGDLAGARAEHFVHVLRLIGQGLRDFDRAAAEQMIDLVGLDRQRLRDFRRRLPSI